MARIFSNEEALCKIFNIDREALIAYRNQIAEKEAAAIARNLASDEPSYGL